MAQPPGYSPVTDFSNDEAIAVSGRNTIRTDKLDAELAAVETTLDALVMNIGLIQRDDGLLRDGTVDLHTLSTATLAFLAATQGGYVPRGAWATATVYAARDLVEVSGSVYVALVAHTSGASFAADQALGRWMVFTQGGGASAVTFTPTNNLASTNVQDAIAEVNTLAQAPTDLFLHTHLGGL